MTRRAEEPQARGDDAAKTGWLSLLCITRVLQTTVTTAWAGVMPQVVLDWQITASQAGLVQSAWYFGYLVSLFVTGFVADRVGPRRVFMVSSVFTAMAAAAFAAGAQGPLSAALLFGFTGLCAGGCYGPGLQLLAANAPPHQRGKAMGFFVGASSLGFALSLGIVATLAGAVPWRTALYAIAALVIAGAVLTTCALRRMRPDPDRNAVPHATAARLAFRETLKDRPAMAGNWAYAAHCWELMALWAWLPAYLAAAAAHHGLAANSGIALAAAAHLVSIVGSLAGGSASDRFGSGKVMMAATCISLTFSLAFGWLWALPFGVLAAVAAVYNLCAIADSSVYSTALAQVVPPARLGAAFSVRSVMGFGAGAVSPWVFGSTLDWAQAHWGLPVQGWGLAWSTVALGAMVGPWMILRFQRLTAVAATQPISAPTRSPAG